MELIDHEGNLFGKINVIDALAILLVIAVVVAGVAVVAPGSSNDASTSGTNETESANETESNELVAATRYATVDLGTHPNRVANQITTGDTMERNGHNLTVTDVYSVPTDATSAAVVVRAELEGELTETAANTTRFVFGGNQSRVGDSLSIETDEYSADGPIQRLDEDGSTLNTESITVDMKIEDVDRDVAASITDGTVQTSRGDTVVTVDSVSTQPAEHVYETEDGELRVQDHPTNRDVRLTLELRTIETESGNQFNDGPLRISDSIRLDLGTITVSGTITGIDD